MSSAASEIQQGLVRQGVQSRSRVEQRRNRWGLVFVSPAVAFLLVVVLGPLLFGFWVSLNSWNPMADLAKAKWVGLDNYIYLLTIDSQFRLAFTNSLIYAASRVVSNLIIGLGLATLLNSRRIRGLKLWRIALFLPMATSPVVLAKVWSALYHKDFGYLNVILGWLGIPAIGWLTNPDTALLAVIIMGVYQFVGYYALIFLAGLQGIQEEILEAARVDGADALGVWWHITLPLLRPVIALVVVVSTINGLQVFDLVYGSTGGGPADATLTIVLQMYRTVFTFGRAGQGAAMGFILFAVVMVLSLVQLRLLRQSD